MDKEKEYKYLQFPNCLLMQTYNEDVESGLRQILRYGIMNYATKLKYSLQDVAKQTAYYYYRKADVLQASVIKKIHKAVDHDLFTPDVDYNGFAGDAFNPEDNITELLKLFESDPQFKNDAILNYQLHLATSNNHLAVKIASNDSLINDYETALQLQRDFETDFGPDALAFCKISMLFEFIENHKDIDLFRAYMGIKSMLGRRNFISSNKPAILSRMIGCKSKAAFEKFSYDKRFISTIQKYGKRYHMDKLLLTLAERRYIMFLSKEKVSVIYLSKYMEPEELGSLIRETKFKQNIKQRIKNVTASL